MEIILFFKKISINYDLTFHLLRICDIRVNVLINFILLIDVSLNFYLLFIMISL